VVAVLLGDLAQGAVLQEDGAQGLVAAVQELRGLAEEGVAKGIVHGWSSGNVTPLFRPLSGVGIVRAQLAGKGRDPVEVRGPCFSGRRGRPSAVGREARGLAKVARRPADQEKGVTIGGGEPLNLLGFSAREPQIVTELSHAEIGVLFSLHRSCAPAQQDEVREMIVDAFKFSLGTERLGAPRGSANRG
jgi:hypothetical protein